MAPHLRTSLGLFAVVSLIAASALQVIASLQRWITASGSWTRTDSTIEDHRFDYFVPSDPWEPIGGAAALLGMAFLLIAAAIVVIALSTRPRGGSSSLSWLVAAVAAGPFVILGLHQVLSGLMGAPSFLAPAASPWIAFLCVVGLIPFIALCARESIVLAPAALALIGNTIVGYLLATFLIAPAIAGYQSYDTTPRTETIVAASPAIAALLIAVELVIGARSRATGPPRNEAVAAL